MDSIPVQPQEEPQNNDQADSQTNLLLPDPFSDYITCPHCGEPEIEVWCYNEGGECHNCKKWVPYKKPTYCGTKPNCKRPAKARN